MNLAVEALGATFTSSSVFTFFSADTPKYVELICLCFEEKQDKGTEHYCVQGVVALFLWDLVQPTSLLGYVVSDVMKNPPTPLPQPTISVENQNQMF